MCQNDTESPPSARTCKGLKMSTRSRHTTVLTATPLIHSQGLALELHARGSRPCTRLPGFTGWTHALKGKLRAHMTQDSATKIPAKIQQFFLNFHTVVFLHAVDSRSVLIAAAPNTGHGLLHRREWTCVHKCEWTCGCWRAGWLVLACNATPSSR
jgi:hypothetical protein